MKRTANLLSPLCLTAALAFANQAVAAEPTVIELTQTPCQFVEAETLKVRTTAKQLTRKVPKRGLLAPSH